MDDLDSEMQVKLEMHVGSITHLFDWAAGFQY